MSDQNHTPDPIDVEVGRRIRLRRKALGLSMQALGDHIGVSYQQQQKYERGANRVSASMLVRIAAKLETTVAALVGEDGHHERAPDDLATFMHSPAGLRLAEAAKGLPSHVLSAVIGLAKDLGAAKLGARG